MLIKGFMGKTLAIHVGDCFLNKQDQPLILSQKQQAKFWQTQFSLLQIAMYVFLAVKS